MTGTTLSGQLLQSCYMILAGALTIVVLDLLRETGRLAKWGKYQYITTEFIAIVLLGLCFFVLLIVRYQGVLRMHIFLALLLGAILYYCTLRFYGIRVCRLIAKGILWLYRKITGMVLFSWKMLYHHVFEKLKRRIQQRRARKQKEKLAAQQECDKMEEII